MSASTSALAPASRLRPCLPAGVCAFAVAVFLVKVTTGSARICLPRPARILGPSQPHRLVVSSARRIPTLSPSRPVALSPYPPHVRPRILTTILAFAPARAPRVSHPRFDHPSIQPPILDVALGPAQAVRVLHAHATRFLPCLLILPSLAERTACGFASTPCVRSGTLPARCCCLT